MAWGGIRPCAEKLSTKAGFAQYSSDRPEKHDLAHFCEIRIRPTGWPF
jgi:hypothetical protein